MEQDNKMTSGNLGIVFGPTLMRPRPTEATISLSSLVDYPHQARIVEALIVFYLVIFEADGVFPDPSEDAKDDGDGSSSQVRTFGEARWGWWRNCFHTRHPPFAVLDLTCWVLQHTPTHVWSELSPTACIGISMLRMANFNLLSL